VRNPYLPLGLQLALNARFGVTPSGNPFHRQRPRSKHFGARAARARHRYIARKLKEGRL
jgi:hypothetical protein